MKITYNFVNGETIAVEVNEEIGRIIIDMRREEETEYRRNRYNEVCLETNLDHSSWNEYIQPEFDDEAERREEKKAIQEDNAKRAIESLTEKQKTLVLSLFGDEPISAKDFAKLQGISPSAITQQKKTIEKKLKKFFKKP